MEGFQIKFTFQVNKHKLNNTYTICNTFNTNTYLQKFIPVVYLLYRYYWKKAAY